MQQIENPQRESNTVDIINCLSPPARAILTPLPSDVLLSTLKHLSHIKFSLEFQMELSLPFPAEVTNA